jgi:hypothetical protein
MGQALPDPFLKIIVQIFWDSSALASALKRRIIAAHKLFGSLATFLNSS